MSEGPTATCSLSRGRGRHQAQGVPSLLSTRMGSERTCWPCRDEQPMSTHVHPRGTGHAAQRTCWAAEQGATATPRLVLVLALRPSLGLRGPRPPGCSEAPAPSCPLCGVCSLALEQKPPSLGCVPSVRQAPCRRGGMWLSQVGSALDTGQGISSLALAWSYKVPRGQGAWGTCCSGPQLH